MNLGNQNPESTNHQRIMYNYNHIDGMFYKQSHIFHIS